MKNIFKILFRLFFSLVGLFLFLEIGLRVYVEFPLKADFYGSVSREKVGELQEKHGLKTAPGPGWTHLGWIADPESEDYIIEKQNNDTWQYTGNSTFGSFLIRESGTYRVWADSNKNQRNKKKLIGEVNIRIKKSPEQSTVFMPAIDGDWKLLFSPKIHGYYINDHDVYKDSEGKWRLVGITSKTDGDFSAEKYFAVGVSKDFPPVEGMKEDFPVTDFGELAWAPEVIEPEITGNNYMMFWSPHRMPRMVSEDGITWKDKSIILSKPYHKFFRDPAIIKTADGQWLLYTTARGAYFSRIDVYQSFDLEHWQYIGAALKSFFGSERNSPFASMESPSVIQYKDGFYLSFTYNNDSFFWPGILLIFKIWPNPESYNDTLVLHSDNPYHFGTYRGRKKTYNIVAQLKAHGPEYIYHPEKDQWFITTAGWPWVASITSGEVAVARLKWIATEKH